MRRGFVILLATLGFVTVVSTGFASAHNPVAPATTINFNTLGPSCANLLTNLNLIHPHNIVSIDQCDLMASGALRAIVAFAPVTSATSFDQTGNAWLCDAANAVCPDTSSYQYVPTAPSITNFKLPNLTTYNGPVADLRCPTSATINNQPSPGYTDPFKQEKWTCLSTSTTSPNTTTGYLHLPKAEAATGTNLTLRAWIYIGLLPSVSWSQSSTTVPVGGSVTLSYTSQYATHLNVSDNLKNYSFTNLPANGSVTLTNFPNVTSDMVGITATNDSVNYNAGSNIVVYSQASPDLVVDLSNISTTVTNTDGSTSTVVGTGVDLTDQSSQLQVVGLVVKNIGTGAAGATLLQCTIGRHQYTTTFQASIAALDAGQSVTVPSVTLPLDAEIAPNMRMETSLLGEVGFDLICTVDPNQLIVESNKSNNITQLTDYLGWTALQETLVTDDTTASPVSDNVVQAASTNLTDTQSALTAPNGIAFFILRSPYDYNVTAFAGDEPLVDPAQHVTVPKHTYQKSIIKIGKATLTLTVKGHVQIPARQDFAIMGGAMVIRNAANHSECHSAAINGKDGKAVFTNLTVGATYELMKDVENLDSGSCSNTTLDPHWATNIAKGEPWLNNKPDVAKFVWGVGPNQGNLKQFTITGSFQQDSVLYYLPEWCWNLNEAYPYNPSLGTTSICTYDMPAYDQISQAMKDTVATQLMRFYHWSVQDPLGFIGKVEIGYSAFPDKCGISTPSNIRLIQYYSRCFNVGTTTDNETMQEAATHELFHNLDFKYHGNNFISRSNSLSFLKLVNNQLTDQGAHPDGNSEGARVWEMQSFNYSYILVQPQQGYSSGTLLKIPVNNLGIRQAEAFTEEFATACTFPTDFKQRMSDPQSTWMHFYVNTPVPNDLSNIIQTYMLNGRLGNDSVRNNWFTECMTTN